MNHAPRTTRGSAGSSGHDLSDLALCALAGLMVLGAALWCGAALAALATGHRAPAGGGLGALGALRSLRDPSSAWPVGGEVPGPVVYWAATLVVLAAIGSVGWFAFRHLAPVLRGPGRDRRDVRTLPGLGTPREARSVAGRAPLLEKAPMVRPTLSREPAKLEPCQVGYRLGRARGAELWCSVEDSALLVGPPRMGKGLHVV